MEVGVEHGVLDVYKAALEDTARIATRRERLENGYITLMTFALAGDGYVAATSQFDNWLPVLLTVGIAAFGLAATVRYGRAVRNLAAALDGRYSWLRELEALPELSAAGANMLTVEYKRLYQSRTGRRFALNLERIFVFSFVMVPVVLAILTALWDIPAVHLYIHPLTASH